MLDALGGDTGVADRILPIHSEMLAAYRRKDWSGAEAGIAAAAGARPGPTLEAFYDALPRAHRHVAGESPPDEWDGA